MVLKKRETPIARTQTPWSWTGSLSFQSQANHCFPVRWLVLDLEIRFLVQRCEWERRKRRTKGFGTKPEIRFQWHLRPEIFSSINLSYELMCSFLLRDYRIMIFYNYAESFGWKIAILSQPSDTANTNRSFSPFDQRSRGSKSWTVAIGSTLSHKSSDFTV